MNDKVLAVIALTIIAVTTICLMPPADAKDIAIAVVSVIGGFTVGHSLKNGEPKI